MSNVSNETFDAIGGGPGGSTAASFIAMQGHRVLLLEREQFPRHQIGESLLPSTIHGICALLGLRDEIKNAGFPRKRGGTFRWGRSPTPWTFAFAKNPDAPGGFAYQVERARAWTFEKSTPSRRSFSTAGARWA
jgi:FAD-dependent halogenase